MRRRSEQEREEADAHTQAEARREALLAELKAREAAGRAPEPPAAEPPAAEPELDESGPHAETAEMTNADEGPEAESDTA
jgi:hypothetical protein